MKSATPIPTKSPSPTATPSNNAGFNDWTTYGYDNQRDGFNPNSTALTPGSLSKLHLAWHAVFPKYDFNTQTQPILATNIGSHAGLLVGGGANGVAFAYDALTGAQVWSRYLGQLTYSCSASSLAFGIEGSAVYDPSSKYVYVTSNVNDGGVNDSGQNYINQLNIADGTLVARVNVAPNPFKGETNFIHTSLTLLNGELYTGTSSTCDISPWRGRLAMVDASTMTLKNTFYPVYNQGGGKTAAMPLSGGGVWGWGGVSVDPGGNIWTGTGNVDVTPGSSGPQAPFVQDSVENDALGEHLVQLSPDLTTVEQSNAPVFNYSGASVDLDFTGTPTIGTPAGCDTVAGVMGKSGMLYMYDISKNISPNGPVSTFKFTPSEYSDPNLGNPAFSPITNLFYAGQSTSVSGGAAGAPGMIGIKQCGSSSNIAWSAHFGPDSLTDYYARSMPTVTAGGVIFVGTDCRADSNGGCTGSGTDGGAVWALNASTGDLLNGGLPILHTGSSIRMAPIVDNKWLFQLDSGGNLYGMTLDSSYPPISNSSHATRILPSLGRRRPVR